jgi:hypothetical protein
MAHAAAANLNRNRLTIVLLFEKVRFGWGPVGMKKKPGERSAQQTVRQTHCIARWKPNY